MVVGMQKKVLSEIGLYYGDVAMPKGFEIDRNKLQEDILKSQIHNKEFPYSREWDKLNTYLREHINVEYGFSLINKKTWGNVYKPQEISTPLLNIDPVDLRNAPDDLTDEENVAGTRYVWNEEGKSWDKTSKNSAV